MDVTVKVDSDFNMMLLSTELVKALKNEGIKVKNVRRDALPEPLRTTICSFTIKNYIFVVIDDIINRFNIEELQVILWHEYAHKYLDTQNEELCDSFAIERVSKEAYDSAVQKSAELTSQLRQLYGITDTGVHKYDYRKAVI